MDKTLKQWLIDVCNERHMSYREASIKAKLDPTAISRFIRGTQPSYDSCLKLAHYFGVSEAYVLGLKFSTIEPCPPARRPTPCATS
jgi:transcriptional regulator with XRE-family HTH domain